MGRRIVDDRRKLLSHRIRSRVDDQTLERLKKLVKAKNCKRVGDVVRVILSSDRIKVYRKDISLEAPVQVLIQIRNELRAIQVNVNQIRNYYHRAQDNRGTFDALKVEESYLEVDNKVIEFVRKVGEFGDLWLRR